MPAPSFTASLPRSSKSRFPKSETHVAGPEDSAERWHIFASFPQPEPLRGFEHAGGHPPQTISWKDFFQAVWTLLNLPLLTPISWACTTRASACSRMSSRPTCG